MNNKKSEEILKLILLKVICYKQNGEYIIFQHDAENTKKKIDEVMDIIRVALLEE